MARDPFLADRFRDGVDKGEGEVFRNFDLLRLMERVGLRPLERLVLASSIAAAPTRRDLASMAVNIIRTEFENAVLALCQHPSFDQADLNPNQVAKLMSNLLCEAPTDGPILDATQRQALIMAAQTKYGPEIVMPILQRILPTIQLVNTTCCALECTNSNPSLQPNATLVSLMIQLGPEMTSDPEIVLALLSRFGMSESTPPQDDQVVEIISQLSRLAAEGPVSADVGTLVHTLSRLVSSQFALP